MCPCLHEHICNPRFVDNVADVTMKFLPAMCDETVHSVVSMVDFHQLSVQYESLCI